MTELYAAAYIAPLPRERLSPPEPSETTRAFYKEVEKSTFPYDIGDDPAFYSASYHNGPVTWGVCRTDVRCPITIGDWMVFFSSEKNGMITRYRFVAALCVENKLRHTSIFEPHVNQVYRSYLNLLIRPNGAGWEHFEPALNPKKPTFKGGWHDDWLWKICEQRALRKQRLLKKDVVADSKRHNAGEPLTIGGNPLQVAENYVVFSTASAVRASLDDLKSVFRLGKARAIAVAAVGKQRGVDAGDDVGKWFHDRAAQAGIRSETRVPSEGGPGPAPTYCTSAADWRRRYYGQEN